MGHHLKFCSIPAALFAVLLAAPVIAQIDRDAAEATPDESGDPLEELVVIGSRPGDKAKADPMYEEILRQQMMDEVERMRLEEEENWRNSNLTYKTSEESRMEWGYDPVEDRSRIYETDLNSMPGDTVKPATLFKAKF